MIEQHNQEAENGYLTFHLGLNKYSDFTPQEIRDSMNGFKQDESNQRSRKPFVSDKQEEIPNHVDWRKSVRISSIS